MKVFSITGLCGEVSTVNQWMMHPHCYGNSGLGFLGIPQGESDPSLEHLESRSEAFMSHKG